MHRCIWCIYIYIQQNTLDSIGLVLKFNKILSFYFCLTTKQNRVNDAIQVKNSRKAPSWSRRRRSTPTNCDGWRLLSTLICCCCSSSLLLLGLNLITVIIIYPLLLLFHFHFPLFACHSIQKRKLFLSFALNIWCLISLIYLITSCITTYIIIIIIICPTQNNSFFLLLLFFSDLVCLFVWLVGWYLII